MSRIDLLEVDQFNNYGYSNSSEFRKEVIFTSPSGSLIAILDTTLNITIYNTTSRMIIPSGVQHKIQTLFFSIDDQYIYYTYVLGIAKYSVENKATVDVIARGSANYISYIMPSPDFKSIIFVNASMLKQMNLNTSKITANQTEKGSSCNITLFNIDRKTGTIVSSSSDCHICSWKINQPTIERIGNTSISSCKINEIDIFNSSVLIAKSINIRKINTVQLDIQTLQVQTTTNHSTYQVSANAMSVNNYIISYAPKDQYIWIYKDNFTNTPVKRSFAPNYVKYLQYNKQKDQIYISFLDSQLTLGSISSYKLTYGCSSVKNTANNDTTLFLQNCPCSNGFEFNKEQMECQQKSCGPYSGVACICEAGYSSNNYNLECQLNCGSIKNSQPSAAYGSNPQCYCSIPYGWNPTRYDCTYVDCAYISNSNSNQVGPFCSCLNGYKWSDSTFKCTSFNDQNTLNSPNKSSPVGIIAGVLVFILFVAVAIFIFYKKCRSSNEPDQNEQHREQPGPTERGINVKGKTKEIEMAVYNIQSNQNLNKDYRSEKSDSDKKQSTVPDGKGDVQLYLFSICDEHEQQEQNNDEEQQEHEKFPQPHQEKQVFSQIDSNIERPLH